MDENLLTDTMSSGLGASLSDPTAKPAGFWRSELKGEATRAAILLQAYWIWVNSSTKSSPKPIPPLPTKSVKVQSPSVPVDPLGAVPVRDPTARPEGVEAIAVGRRSLDGGGKWRIVGAKRGRFEGEETGGLKRGMVVDCIVLLCGLFWVLGFGGSWCRWDHNGWWVGKFMGIMKWRSSLVYDN